MDGDKTHRYLPDLKVRLAIVVVGHKHNHFQTRKV